MLAITLDQAVNAREALRELIKQNLPAKDAFSLVRLIQKLDQELTAFEQTRAGLIRQYGVAAPELGEGMVRFEGEGREEWERQIAELLAQTIDLPPARVRLSTLGPIAPATLLPLLWLIEDDTEGAEQAAVPATP